MARRFYGAFNLFHTSTKAHPAKAGATEARVLAVRRLISLRREGPGRDPPFVQASKRRDGEIDMRRIATLVMSALPAACSPDHTPRNRPPVLIHTDTGGTAANQAPADTAAVREELMRLAHTLLPGAPP